MQADRQIGMVATARLCQEFFGLALNWSLSWNYAGESGIDGSRRAEMFGSESFDWSMLDAHVL